MAFSAEILTLFPRMISGYASESILGKAAEKGLISIVATDVRVGCVIQAHVGRHPPFDSLPQKQGIVAVGIFEVFIKDPSSGQGFGQETFVEIRLSHCRRAHGTAGFDRSGHDFVDSKSFTQEFVLSFVVDV